MATGREGDTSLWLHNKLGTSNDTWVGGSICSQYNLDVLGNIRECFLYLQPQVKLKLLLSFFHIPRRNADEWHSELEEILELGRVDSDPWVSMVAEIMLPYPATGCLSEEFNTSEVSGQIFHTLLGDIKKIIQDKTDGGSALTPLESQYLNHSALTDLYGSLPPPVQHFKLKRKPKAAALRADLLNKSVEAANQLKKHPMPTVPLRSRGLPRKLTDTTPLKGIPSRTSGSFGRSMSGFGNFTRSGVRSLAGPKEGGIKLLDINEQPFGVGLSAAAKKKMKMDAELAEKAAAVSAQPPKGPTTPVIESGKAQLSEDMKPLRPDYAPEATDDLTAPRTRTFSGLADVTTSPQDGAVAEEYTDQQEQIQQHVSDNLAILTERKPPVMGIVRENSTYASLPNAAQQPAPARVFYTARTLPENVQQAALPMGSPPLGSIPAMRTPGLTYTTLQPVHPSGSPLGTPANPMLVMSQPTLRHIVSDGGMHQQQLPNHLTLMGTAMMQQVQPTRTVQLPATSPGGGVTTIVAQQAPPQLSSANQGLKKGLSLTREQMAEAQEMFRTANKVTRPEKALILGFMAGSRDNPCPHLGNIVTIKLSEELETLPQPNGTVVEVSIETLFQMNYNTGEWRRLRKQRSLQSVQ